MFTGLVEVLGTVRDMTPGPGGVGRNLTVSAPNFAGELTLGESVAVNGACLTVVASNTETCRFQVGPETLLRTNLGALRPDDRVNLERSLCLGDRLGGHLVQGHVDGVGHVAERRPGGGSAGTPAHPRRADDGESEEDWVTVWFSCPPELAAQMVSKGSVAVDGVSLTLVDVADDRFSVALIPHTLANTTLGCKPVGAAVNLETDLLAKYVWKCLQSHTRGPLPHS
jgi:riboflavin synthase